MAIHDFTSERLFVEAPLAEGAAVACSPEQVNYLINVLRMKAGAALLVFNSRDGEWRARIDQVSKRAVVLVAEAQTRPQSDGPDIDYLFAPLKHARLDYMVQKATEMGVKRLRPVLTRRTIAERVNLDRMRANAIEAAEQCGVLRVPEVRAPVKLTALLEAWDDNRVLIFCDEGAEVANPVVALGAIERAPLGVLIGPEGGFADEERDAIRSRPYTCVISLGPRILRADTAAVAALAVVNAVLGDWN
jgi:16S rRNA (uracil1498-N3)-methyltransferase